MRLGLRSGFGPSGGAAFTPASLSPTAWYDPSDLATVWQDSARTTPASVNGVVGALDDKSGNGNHLIQATGAAKPILRQSGALYWIETDGVDDYMDATGVAMTQPNALWFASNPLALTGHHNDGITVRQALNQNLLFHAGAANPATGNSLSIGVPAIIAVQVDGANTYARKDGVNAAAISPGTTGLTGFRFATFSAGSQHYNGRFAGIVLVDRLLTAGEMASLDTYLAAKQGRVL